MLLAGGQGSRLGALTSNVAKPAVSFGGKFRIIDFALSNCVNSGISTVGVLTQYRPYLLHSYIGTGSAWDLDDLGGGVSILPPFATQKGGAWYEGTADAVTQNIDYIEQNDSEYVLILSGDQLYRMDYGEMLACHKEHNADLTIAVMPVPWEEASRFGIITVDDDGRLQEDAFDQHSTHDFGKDVIPRLLEDGKRLYSYRFEGFWRDVGTISSYHETSMDLLGPEPAFDIFTSDFPILSNASTRPPAYVGPYGRVDDCLIGNGCIINGTARHSILSTDAVIEAGARVVDSVLLPGAHVKAGAQVVRAIMGENSTVEENVHVGSVDQTKDTAVIGNDVVVGRGE